MRTQMTPSLVCPYCGTKQTIIQNNNKQTCEKCKKEFKYKKFIFFSSEKVGD